MNEPFYFLTFEELENKLADSIKNPPETENELLARKTTCYRVSEELLMDHGVISAARECKPLTRRERFWFWRNRTRENFAIWLYEHVSGDKFPDWSDD